MIKRTITTLVLTTSMFSQAQACNIEGTSGFFPKNKLQLAPNLIGPVSLNKTDYLEMLEKFKTIYTPILAQIGAQLDLVNLWEDGEINAYAHRKKGDNIYSIEVMGGLVRHPLMTKDVLALVICHELGHHLGGAPKKSPIEEDDGPKRSDGRNKFALFGFPGKKPKAPKSNWSSTEGQADYYAALKCMRKYYEYVALSSPLTVVSRDSVFPSENCAQSFPNETDSLICQRVMDAGLQMALIFQSLKKIETKISFETPSNDIVKKTIEGYPTVQCRLDTYVQGALCDQDSNLDVSNTNPDTGVCSMNDSKRGARPQCWYKN